MIWFHNGMGRNIAKTLWYFYLSSRKKNTRMLKYASICHQKYLVQDMTYTVLKTV